MLTSITSPPTGAYRSLTALTLSISPKLLPAVDLRSHRGQLDHDQVGQLIDGESGDPDRRDIAFEMDPLVSGVTERFEIHEIEVLVGFRVRADRSQRKADVGGGSQAADVACRRACKTAA